MRKQVHLAKTSFYFLSLLLLCCWLVQPAHAQDAYDSNDVTGQLLFSGLSFCFPQAKDMTANVLALRKISSGLIPCPYVMPENAGMFWENKTTGATKNNSSPELLKLIDSLYMSGIDFDSIESKETAATTAPISVPATAIVNENKPMSAAEVASFKASGSLFDTETDIIAEKYAEKISAEPEDVRNFPLYKFIDQWYGTRYKFGGTDNNGIDCSAFSQKLYNDVLGISIPRTARQQHKNCEVIKDSDDAVEGDLIFFRVRRVRISHVGVYLANGYFVHASRSHGIVISSLNDKYWQRRYAGCGRIEKDDKAAAESDFMQ